MEVGNQYFYVSGESEVVGAYYFPDSTIVDPDSTIVESESTIDWYVDLSFNGQNFLFWLYEDGVANSSQNWNEEQVMDDNPLQPEIPQKRSELPELTEETIIENAEDAIPLVNVMEEMERVFQNGYHQYLIAGREGQLLMYFSLDVSGPASDGAGSEPTLRLVLYTGQELQPVTLTVNEFSSHLLSFFEDISDCSLIRFKNGTIEEMNQQHSSRRGDGSLESNKCLIQ
ncbi:hypothetical protein ACH42_04820 [Endozoicomonas sp. (ex Bugula neritina AB1)]|nr:hypothetical protein ACH42_04820 [Endozoicomonas sp. (ex Bugula neritina AB1)]